jgi:hypothetical protein
MNGVEVQFVRRRTIWLCLSFPHVLVLKKEIVVYSRFFFVGKVD